MMKLGILAVYQFDEKHDHLVDLHLSQIASCTEAPWTIYASANRLDEKRRAKLARRRGVRMCEIPRIDAEGDEARAYFLNHLARIAIEDGCTHLAIMQHDTFPVRDAWEEELAARLGRGCAFITLNRVSTAFLFAPRAFFLRCNPTCELTKDDEASEEGRRFLAAHANLATAGAGYAFAAWRNELTWRHLASGGGGAPHAGHGVFDELIFHLGNANIAEHSLRIAPNALRAAHAGLARSASRAARSLLPFGFRRALFRLFRPLLDGLIIQPQRLQQLERITRFLRDPRANPNAFAESARRVI